MAPTTGKRKRGEALADPSHDSESPLGECSSIKAQALFQQHYEARFLPLEDFGPQQNTANDIGPDTVSDDIESGSEWEGFSEGDEPRADVVQYTTSALSRVDIPKDELKTFMTAKPPIAPSKPASTAKRKQLESTNPDEALTDVANLKKDLALQRLLKESHLLDPNLSLSHSGLNRHKALDLRLQDMGSKSSIFLQQKMPLAQRKGMNAKAAEREEHRRKEAQENGIILEKTVKGRKMNDLKRQRGIGAPTVGKFQAGMLKLSRKDVAEIEGPKVSSRGKN